MPNVNQINDAWVASGQKVSDLNAKLNAAVLDDAFDQEKFKDMKEERDNEVVRRDALKDQLDQARAEAKTSIENNKPIVIEDKNGHKAFAQGIRDLMKGKVKKLNLVSSNADPATTSGAGLTIPPDIETNINELIRQYDILQPLVNTESVSTPTGSRVIEQFELMKPLVALTDEDTAASENDEPKLKTVSYEIVRYSGYNRITNTLLKDTDQNLITWLTKWIARKVVVTRNNAIITSLKAAPKKATIAKYDDLIDMANSLDPAINNTGVFLTNLSGFTILNKVKDAMGMYLLQRDPQVPMLKNIDGHNVMVVSDNWMPDISSGTHPIYFGALSEYATLFDRENMSLATTTEGGDSFLKDQTWIRVIDRFDVEVVDDGALTAGSFSAIADQKANFAASATSNA